MRVSASKVRLALVGAALLALGSGPAWAMADSERLFVTNRDAGEMTVVDGRAGELLARLQVGKKPTYSAATPDGRYAFATATGDRQLVVVDTRTQSVVARLPLGESPKGVEVSPDGKFVLVANEGAGSNSISIFEIGAWKLVAEAKVGMAPHNIAFAKSTGIAYITNGESKSISKIRWSDGTVLGEIPLDERGMPHNLATTPDDRYLFVARKGSDDVAVIDLASEEVVAYIPVSKGHHAVDASPDGRFVYVSGIGADVINVIDVARMERVAEIPVGDGPHGVRFSPDGQRAYVAVAKAGKVAVIDTAAQKVVAEVDNGGFPFWVAVAPR